jgi:hypothetical protein
MIRSFLSFPLMVFQDPVATGFMVERHETYCGSARFCSALDASARQGASAQVLKQCLRHLGRWKQRSIPHVRKPKAPARGQSSSRILSMAGPGAKNPPAWSIECRVSRHPCRLHRKSMPTNPVNALFQCLPQARKRAQGQICADLPPT